MSGTVSLGGSPVGTKRGLFTGQFGRPAASPPAVQFGAPDLSIANLWQPASLGPVIQLGGVLANNLGPPAAVPAPLTRESWIAQRVASRYVERGDQMILRRTSLLAEEVGHVNPPVYAPDLAIATAYTDPAGRLFFGMRASSLDGRLRVGDKFTTVAGLVSVTWTVLPMPKNIQTDEYGAQQAEPSGKPIYGLPAVYSNDAVAGDNVLQVIPVVSAPAPTLYDFEDFVGCTPSFTFLADEVVYGAAMSLSQQIELGWTESQDLGISLAGTRADGSTISQLKVDDALVINGVQRNILTISTSDRRSSKFLYQLRLR